MEGKGDGVEDVHVAVPGVGRDFVPEDLLGKGSDCAWSLGIMGLPYRRLDGGGQGGWSGMVQFHI